LSLSFSAPGLFGSVGAWLGAMPHPPLCCEIAPDCVAVARHAAKRGRSLEQFAIEPLPAGAVRPSPVESNVLQQAEVETALGRALERLGDHGRDVTLIVPDLAARVLLLHFDNLPQRRAEARSLIQWRLKKSLPFPVEDAVVSWQEQPNPAGGVELMVAVARRDILRQYEVILEAAGYGAGVILPSTLAALPLLEGVPGMGGGLTRLNGGALTTAIERDGMLCLYRSVEMSPADATGRALFDEIYPSVVYFQDNWHSPIGVLRVGGLEGDWAELRAWMEREAGCRIAPLEPSRRLEPGLTMQQKETVDRYLAAAVGWMLNR